MNPPTLIAHRGYTQHYPENTLASLKAAVAAGACCVEFDVHLTADHVPVLSHDHNLVRTADLDRCVHDINSADAQQISVHEPQRLGDKFTGECIPTLEQVARYLATTPKTRAFVEIKRESLRRFGVERVMKQTLDALNGVLHQCVIISFDEDALRYARTHAHAPIGFVFEPWSNEALDALRVLQPEFVFTDYVTVPENLIALPPGRWAWALYEITDPLVAMQFAALGAAYIETYAIGEMLRDPALHAGGCFER